jgi:vitamin B12 transporter
MRYWKEWVAAACVAMLAAAAEPAAVAAQQPAEQVAQADSALAACLAVSQRTDREAKTIVARAETRLRALVRAYPTDAGVKVRLARLLTQCRIPLAGFMAAARLSGESNRLLEDALALDPTHWEARFSLALNHFHAPAFLGRGDDARRELERLLAQQGERGDRPNFALPYLYLGRLHARSGRHAEARAVWERGAALFPGDEPLRRALEEAGSTSALPADARPVAADRSVPGGTASADTVPRVPAAADDAVPDFVLADLVIEAGAYHVDDARGASSLSRIDVYTTPGGTADVLQVFQLMPGATRATEGSDLYVRGGDPAETPVFVDGARLIYAGSFETVHGGLFGVLDPSLMRRTYFSSGGFSARWGNALSGVLEVETEGRPERRSWRAGVNMVQLGATGRTPLGESAGAWASLRASESSLLLHTHGRAAEFDAAPRSLEATVALTAEPAPGVELKATALAEVDDASRVVSAYGYEGGFRSRGGTRLVALSGRQVRADGRALTRGATYYTERVTGFRFGVLERERTDRSFGARLDHAAPVGPAGLLRAGVEAQRLLADIAGSEPVTERLAPGSPARELTGMSEHSAQLGGYAEAEWQTRSRVAFVAGVRADRLPAEGAWTADPRVALAWAPGDWVLRAGGGIFHQGRWRTRYRLPNAGSPTGIARRATHLAGGVEYAGDPGVRLELYRKAYDRYVDHAAGPATTAGRSAGVDAIVRWRTTDPLSGWLAYSWLDARVRLEDGRTVPAANGITHTLTCVARLNFLQVWQLGTTARYGTGRPYTPVLGAAEDGGPRHGETHAGRLPDFVRLDARLTRFVHRSGGLVVAYLETLNVLDRANVVGYTWDEAYAARQSIHSFFAARTAVLGVELQF